MSVVRKKSTVDPKSIGPSLCVTELVQLTQLGIPLEHVTWPRVTITPSQWLCIRHTMTCRNASSSADRCSVVTVFNPQRSAPQTYKVEARCAKLNPDKPLLAITDQWALYLYSTRTKKLLHKSRLERDLVYWAWVTPSTLGLVTRDAVFHWDCSSAPTVPVFMFSLHQRIRNTELVGYVTDPGLKWLAVTGLFQEEQVVSGLVQLYSVDRRVNQLLPGQTAARGAPPLDRAEPTRQFGAPCGDPLPRRSSSSTPLDKFDFPVCLQVSSSQGLVYVLTKCGVVHLCDLETMTPLCLHVVCPDITFHCLDHTHMWAHGRVTEWPGPLS
ncbi:hypothetical protein MRX96_028321 [Rhipicephalus microplus]